MPPHSSQSRPALAKAIALWSFWHNLTIASFQVRDVPDTIFLFLGSGLPGSCAGAIAVPAHMGQFGTKWDTKPFVLNTAGANLRRYRGDKVATLAGNERVMTGQSRIKHPPAPRSNVIKCRLLSYILRLSGPPSRNGQGLVLNPWQIRAQCQREGTGIMPRIYNAIDG